MRYNFAAGSFYIMKLCRRLFSFIVEVEIVQKTTNLGILIPIVLRAVVLTQYRRVMDGQTDGIAVADTALAM